MTEEHWVLIIGVPIIVWLAVRAARQARAVRRRIAEVQDEMERNPQSAWLALGEMLSSAPASPSKTPQEKPRGKRID